MAQSSHRTAGLALSAAGAYPALYPFGSTAGCSSQALGAKGGQSPPHRVRGCGFAGAVPNPSTLVPARVTALEPLGSTLLMGAPRWAGLHLFLQGKPTSVG